MPTKKVFMVIELGNDIGGWIIRGVYETHNAAVNALNERLSNTPERNDFIIKPLQVGKWVEVV